MTMTWKRVEHDGPVPRGMEPIHLSRCEHCHLWERSGYIVTGTCRRHPHPQTYAWEKCPAWTYKLHVFDWTLALEHATRVVEAEAASARRGRRGQRRGQP